MKKIIILAVLFPLWGLGGLHAQKTTNEQPYGLQQRSAGQGKQSQIVLPSPDVRKLAIEDSINESSRFAVAVFVNYTPYNSGVWEQLPNGDKVWRLRIKIPDALSTHTYYDRFWLPDGGKFFVYSEETGQSMGAFISQFTKGSKDAPDKFSTPLIYGESVVYEYYQPASVRDTVDIVINRIDYGYRSVKNPYQKGVRGGLDPCHEDICQTNNFQNERNAVVRIRVQENNSSSWVTGYLVNNTKNDNTPYVITTIFTLFAGAEGLLGQWDFDFGFTDCSNPVTVTGATLVAKGYLNSSNIYGADFMLLKLNGDPRENNVGFTPYYLGWDISEDENNVTQTGAYIYHPNGDYQKYGLYNKIETYPYGQHSYSESRASAGTITSILPEGAAWDIHFNFGFGHHDEFYSSRGAPMLDASNRVIGTYRISRSDNQCSNYRIYAEKFSHAWTGGGAVSSANRLNFWLDPCNTGATTCNGIGDVGGAGNGVGQTTYTPVQGIVSTTTWSTPREIIGDIVIPSGVTLTITSEVKCKPNVKITVQPNGKLVINGGILTSGACGTDLWEGITVIGNENLPQTDANQGVVELKNGATIKDAVCAIHVGSRVPIPIIQFPAPVKPRYMYFGGGIVRANSAYFINNQQAINFVSYDDGYYANGWVRENKSYFKGCEFRLDDLALFMQSADAQVKLNSVVNIPFTNCDFIDARTKDSMSNSTIGIYASSSNIIIGEYPTNTYSFAPQAGCSFSGFYKAINLLNSDASKIYASTFTGNHIGILSESSQNLKVEKCKFEIPLPNPFFVNTGIYLKNSSLYNIVNNYIEGEDPLSRQGTGIVCESSGTTNNSVKNNTLKNLCTACHAIGVNGDHSSYETRGLVYQCNKFENNYTDISTAPNSRIRLFQSGERDVWASGNVFDNSTYNIYSKGDYFVYKYLWTRPEHLPKMHNDNYVANTVTLMAEEGHCCVSYGYGGDYYYTIACNYSFVDRTIDQCEDAYSTAKNNYDVRVTDYINNGFGDVLIEWGNADVQGIVSQLQMADGSDFTITIDGLEPSNDLEHQIVLFYEISNAKQQMDKICYTALEILANDTAGLDMSEYRLWISRFNTVESDYALADSYINFGEFADAGNILSAMPSKFPYLDMGTHQHYLDYVVAAQAIDLLLHEDYTLSPSFFVDVIEYFKANNLLPSFLLENLIECFGTQSVLPSEVIEMLRDAFINKTEFFPFWKQKTTQYLIETARLPDVVINELFDNFADTFENEQIRSFIENKIFYPYWQNEFRQYLDAQGFQSFEIDSIIAEYQAVSFSSLFVDTLIDYFNANFFSDYWKNLLFNYVIESKQVPGFMVNNFVQFMETGSEIPYNLMYELVSNVPPIEISPLLYSLTSLLTADKLLNFLYDNSVCIAEKAELSADFLPALLVYAEENSTFPQILKDELFHSFGIDIIPTYLIDGLVILSSYDDFVSIRAYSLGEKLFENWTETYPHTFTVHPSCVCNQDEDNQQPQNTPVNDNTPSQESQTPEKPILSIAEKGEIIVKPNPTKNQLQVISYELQVSDVEIYSVVGQKVGAYPCGRPETTIDVSHLANGMYFLKIQTNNGIITKKFTKN